MSAMWDMLKNIIVEDLLKKMTKGVKDEIADFIIRMDEKVKRTKNQYDDYLWKELKDIFNIK